MLENLASFFVNDDFAESIVVDGTTVSAIFDLGSELQLGEVLALGRSVLLPAASVPSVAEGSTVVVRSVTHRVRQVLQEPPDGLLVRLVLAKV